MKNKLWMALAISFLTGFALEGPATAGKDVTVLKQQPASDWFSWENFDPKAYVQTYNALPGINKAEDTIRSFGPDKVQKTASELRPLFEKHGIDLKKTPYSLWLVHNHFPVEKETVKAARPAILVPKEPLGETQRETRGSVMSSTENVPLTLAKKGYVVSTGFYKAGQFIPLEFVKQDAPGLEVLPTSLLEEVGAFLKKANVPFMGLTVGKVSFGKTDKNFLEVNYQLPGHPGRSVVIAHPGKMLGTKTTYPIIDPVALKWCYSFGCEWTAYKHHNPLNSKELSPIQQKVIRSIPQYTDE